MPITQGLRARAHIYIYVFVITTFTDIQIFISIFQQRPLLCNFYMRKSKTNMQQTPLYIQSKYYRACRFSPKWEALNRYTEAGFLRHSICLCFVYHLRKVQTPIHQPMTSTLLSLLSSPYVFPLLSFPKILVVHKSFGFRKMENPK